MKGPASPRESDFDRDDAADADGDPTPTEAPRRPSASDITTALRPQLVRLPPGRLTEINRSPDTPPADPSTASGARDDARDKSQKARHGGMGTHGVRGKVDSGNPNQGSGELEDLRDALEQTIRNPHIRTRRSYGQSSGKAEKKRVSPIKEEGSHDSPSSLNAAVLGFAADEPVRTASTESTESQRTIRGSMPSTPYSNQPLRTPSYPFPYVPGTPRWREAFHQPFTSLSPTATSQLGAEGGTPGRDSLSMTSGGSTPAAATHFGPPGETYPLGPEDPRFPTPSLYDLVLQMNTEPGLEQWWTSLTKILQESFGAERATLTQPVDPTDIENVPWGQRATWSRYGHEEYAAHAAGMNQITTPESTSGSQRPEFRIREPSQDSVGDLRPRKLHPERLRPRLEARHSYAGHGREVREVLNALNDPPLRAKQRPQGMQRGVTHAAGMLPTMGPDQIPPKRFPSAYNTRHASTSLSDHDFSSVGGGLDTGPYLEVFTTLRALNQEIRPLVEAEGINRVLERGRPIVITRDYSDPDTTTESRSAPAASSTGEWHSKLFGNYRNALAPENQPLLFKDYQEYEQHPPSPWAQSPAPSPAIQADEDINPFFASDDQLLEETFNSSISPQDYTKYHQIEAIGVDHASTVVHIPLVHPTLSQVMQRQRMKAKSQSPGVLGLQRHTTLDLDRKVPIAILSILAPIVPYPGNLAHSLKLLGPHLATSLQMSQQFSIVQAQVQSIQQRRSMAGPAGAHPMTIEPTSLEDIMNVELEEIPGSISGSVTSPSDYSGRSRISPSGSIVGTPGWDPAAHGWTQSRSVAGTPALSGTEMVDNYFDAKKRPGARPSNASSTQNSSKSTKKISPSDSRTLSEEFAKTPRIERKSIRHSSTKEDQSPATISARERSPPRSAEGTSPQKQNRANVSAFPEFQTSKQHSLLHSYGADLQSTFGIAPTAHTTGAMPTSGVGAYARRGSHPEDMPPPSERLLRTIIDSVPVQIFTAQPESGNLTWVNSKFLIYRGQQARQVLDDPWAAIHPQERDQFMDSWRRSLRSDQQLQQKVRLQRFDGNYRWFYVRAAPLKDKHQKVVHWIGTMMDFHEQQIAEHNAARQAETAASEKKYRALANSSPQIVFAVSKLRGVTFCNTQWLSYSGQSEAQALGAGFMENVHPDDLVKCRLPTFDGDQSIPTNVPTSLPTEPRRTFSNSASSDSSETERPGSIADSTSSPIAQMPPRQLSELAATGILKISHDSDGRPSYSTEVRLKSRDGDFRWHLVRVLLAEPLMKHESAEETWYGTCTDINDHKALERDLKTAMDEKTRFLSNMSHEIRTPLNGITGMVNFLIDSSLTAEQMEHVNIIRASTEGLRGLINDILDLSKAEAGMIQLNCDWLYVRALIEEVNDLTSAMAVDKGLELNYVVEANVPSQVKGDRFRIRQILLNIVGNAIKFTQTGEVFVRCSVGDGDGHLSPNEMHIRFDIIDSGPGFTDKEAEFLFKRFSQIDGTSTRQHGGTGLGLVISKQLAQLHGGDMSAKGVPNKGSTFSFYIKTHLPSETDRPPAPVSTPVPTPGISIPLLPMSPGAGPLPMLHQVPSLSSEQAILSPTSAKFAAEVTQTPPQYSDAGKESPSVSSASSDPSIHSAVRTSSLRSERSSASSVPDINVQSVPMKLAMPHPDQKSRTNSSSSRSIDAAVSSSSKHTLQPPSATLSPPPMFSILVVAPLKYTREATVRHIDQTLPKNIPHQITSRETYEECRNLLQGDVPVIFTHVVVVLQNVDEIVTLMDQILQGPNSTTAIVLITDLAQRKKIMEQQPKYDYDQLVNARRLRFVFKPLKPSRFGLIFDPQKEREMSLDRNQDSAQQAAVSQKQVFEELARRLGNREKRVLLVEDNKVNQMVILKFLAKVSIKVDTALDGVQCTEKVYAQPHGYYSIILCDLHMPNKDGYQTCKEIRKWEKKQHYPYLPIIALSANVLDDVYQKCVDAGFNSYMTKPVDFKELSTVLMTFMDPSDPSKPHELMKKKAKEAKRKA